MTKISTLRFFTLIIAGLFVCGGFFAPAAYGNHEDTVYSTGLPELTPEELDRQNRHMLRVKKVKLNKLGKQRINAHRKAKGLHPRMEADEEPPEIGQDIEGVVGATPDEPQTTESLPGDMPSYIDNSTLKYFPPIRSQGSLPSCGVFNGTYYAMTYMYALANDIDAKTGGDAYHLSPKWTYNMVNGGTASGTWYYWAYEIGQKHGCATYADFPYDSNYREWSRDPVVWREAIDRRFDQYGYVNNTDTDAGINLVKEMILNGYILNIPTYIYSWQYKTIADDPSTTADDPFVGKSCVYWVNGTSGYHAMTVVGYNDDIWVDINSNGDVDAGEKGAFRIANSWGTGWGEAGFRWMAYDALKNPSAVSGGPSSGRKTGWYPSRAHWVTAKANYQPTMVAEFTINHLKRNQLRVTLGTSDVSQTTPQTTWYPEMIYFQGGAYAFDGTTTAVDGTFVFDFTDIAPSTTGELRYYVGIYDNSSGDPAELSSFTLYDEVNMESVTSTEPVGADAGIGYAMVDYDPEEGSTVTDYYPSDPTLDITWSAGTTGVSDIQTAFNDARQTENLQLGIAIPMLNLPSQAEWDAMTDGEKALWLINRERIDRGVHPLHGLEENVTSVAQYYAQYLIDNNAWGHYEDGNSPWERLAANPAIGACHDYLGVAENLAVFMTTGSSIPLPIERSVFNWMYNDGACCSWGHRHAILWNPYTENSGDPDMEGFLGIGRASGPYSGWNFAEMIVMNVFDPCSEWDYRNANNDSTPKAMHWLPLLLDE